MGYLFCFVLFCLLKKETVAQRKETVCVTSSTAGLIPRTTSQASAYFTRACHSLNYKTNSPLDWMGLAQCLEHGGQLIFTS